MYAADLSDCSSELRVCEAACCPERDGGPRCALPGRRGCCLPWLPDQRQKGRSSSLWNGAGSTATVTSFQNVWQMLPCLL